MPWLKLNAGSIVFDINMKDCNATELIQLKIKGAGININQKNREVPKEEMIYLACALKNVFHKPTITGNMAIQLMVTMVFFWKARKEISIVNLFTTWKLTRPAAS